jgi:signal transduction histidine kinase
MGIYWFAIGLATGVFVTVLAARWQIRRSLAKQLSAERRAQASERLAELGAMTSGLAHEIKNPLSTIGLNAQLLAEGLDGLRDGETLDGAEKQRLSRRLGTLRREIERLRGILSDFLNYAGELRLDHQLADVNKLVEELADFFQPQAQQQGVRLRTELAQALPQAYIDVPHVKQAVLNLMINALQAIGPNNQGTASPKLREIILRTNDDSSNFGVILHVIDTGPGIPPELHSKIFTPYFTTKGGGMGLGLPTASRIIKAHGGWIEAETLVGEGTDFIVRLPTSTDPVNESRLIS